MRNTGDLTPIGVFLSVIALNLWIVWCLGWALVTPLASRQRDRRLLYLTPVVYVIVLPLGLLGTAVVYPERWDEKMLICLFVGILLPAAAVWLIPWLGLSGRDDVAERRNRPAAWAICGGVLGLTLAYAEAAGGTYLTQQTFVALVAGGLSMVAFLLLWGILEKQAACSEAITVDRDAGAACRLTALLPVLGLLVGQVAPVLLSTGLGVKTLAAAGGPAVLLLAAVVGERRRDESRIDWNKLLQWKKLAERRQPARAKPAGSPTPLDMVIALSYLGAAILWTYLAR